MRIGPSGEPTPETFIEAWMMAKQKANEQQQPASYAGFYVTPDHPKESQKSKIIWLIVFTSSPFWGVPLLVWLFGSP